jgi:hypothetical protein
MRRTLVDAIRQREGDLDSPRRELVALDQLVEMTTVDPATIERDLRAKLGEWRELLRRHAPQARRVLKKLLVAPLRFMPCGEGDDRYYEFTAQIALGRVFNGIASAFWVASPAGARDTYEPGPGEAYELLLGGTVRKAA